jgi:hypothetical protein
MRVAVRSTLVAIATLALGSPAIRGLEPPGSASFASEIERLSEPEGSFDTDNLISNERAYLHVIPAIVSGGVSGGAYIGVGPDQNFSYIARIRPMVAYIIDIRRDNLLLHLLFKALFARSATRVEYLSLLTGRAPPGDLGRWRQATIGELTNYIDSQAPVLARVDQLRRQLDAAVSSFGVRLSRADLDTIARFHRTFIDAGLGLQFRSFGRPPQPYYPTFRDLLVATDAGGHRWNYLASEDDFLFVKALEARDGLIPVVGNVAGAHAMRAIADTIAARGYHISAFYVSNIESYLYRDGSFGRFAENVSRLPRDAHSVIIRSIFGGAGNSTSAVEPIASETLRLTPGPR